MALAGNKRQHPQYDCFNNLRACAQQRICEEFETLLNKLSDPCTNVSDLIDDADVLCDPSKIRKYLWDKFADTEKALSAGYWKTKSKEWLTISGVPVGYREYNGLNSVSKTVTNIDFYGPSLKVAFNYLHTNVSNGTARYFNGWASIDRLNSFAEQTATTWNQLTWLSDSSQNVTATKDVYNYDSVNYTMKYLPAAGAQYIQFFSVYKYLVGVDLTYRFDVFPRLLLTSKDYFKHTLTGGIVFPLNIILLFPAKSPS